MIQSLFMNITGEEKGCYTILIKNEIETVTAMFHPELKELQILGDSELSNFLLSNEYQFRKLLHNKRPNTYYVGFKLKFSVIDGKDIARFNDRKNIIALDGNSHDVIVKSKFDKRSLVEVFTDGSYNEKRRLGAFTVLIKDLKGNYRSESFFSKGQSSSLIELEAVIKALEIIETDVRIITDSQYVRKGITEWIVHWKLNQWTTANGTKAKNIQEWKYLDQLCHNRYIELEWVKAHSHHFENDYCDLKCREMILKIQEE